MKTLCILLLLTCIASKTSSQSNPENKKTFSFQYDKIPFGEKLNDVLKLVDFATVEEDDPDCKFVNDYDILDSFNNGLNSVGSKSGLYPMKLTGIFFLSPSVTKKYKVTYEGWDDIQEINLYFVKYNNEDADYTLFMVHKVQQPVSGTYTDVFDDFKNSISKTLATKARVFNRIYTPHLTEGQDAQALVCEWIKKDIKVILLMRDIVSMEGDPEIIYINRKGWDKYIKSAASHDKERSKEAKKLEPNF